MMPTGNWEVEAIEAMVAPAKSTIKLVYPFGYLEPGYGVGESIPPAGGV